MSETTEGTKQLRPECAVCKEHGRVDQRCLELEDQGKTIMDALNVKMEKKLFYIFLPILAIVLLAMGGLTLNSGEKVTSAIHSLELSMVERFGGLEKSFAIASTHLLAQDKKISHIEGEFDRHIEEWKGRNIDIIKEIERVHREIKK